jgi:hypothetical protein
MSIYRHRSKIMPILIVLLCFASPASAHAQETGFAVFSFTPFSAGLVGGIITGMFAPNTRWYKFGPVVWFACWVFLYTVVLAFLAERPLEVIPTALIISGGWGLIPFASTFFLGRFFTKKLRVYFVSHGKH